MKLNLQFLYVALYLNYSNDAPKLNMHKYTNYNTIEIHINRLSTTMQIFCQLLYSLNYSNFFQAFVPIFEKLDGRTIRIIFPHFMDPVASMWWEESVFAKCF